MDDRKVIRNSSIELLRLVSMLLIIVLHIGEQGLRFQDYCIGTGGGNFTVDYSCDVYLLNFCIIGVNVFLLISGYFSIKLRWQAVARFLFLCLSFKFLHLFIEYKFADAIITVKTLLNVISVISHPSGWFVRCYFYLMLLSPILNKALDDSNIRELKIYSLLVILISVYFGFIRRDDINSDGYTLMQFVTMYVIGRTVYKVKLTEKATTIQWLGLYASAAILNSIIMNQMLPYNKEMSFHLLGYNSPLVMLSSVSFFCVFAKQTFYNMKLNAIAKGAFGIYLFHTGPFLWRRILCPYIWETYESSAFSFFLFMMAGLTLVLMSIGIGLNLIFDSFYSLVISKLKERR